MRPNYKWLTSMLPLWTRVPRAGGQPDVTDYLPGFAQGGHFVPIEHEGDSTSIANREHKFSLC